MKKDSRKWLGNLLLLITAVIWGSAFVAQRSGMEDIGPFTFLASRSVLTAASLTIFGLPLFLKKDGKDRLTALRSGFLCGLFLFSASALQQIGIVTTPAGKAGFLTALYIIFVPVCRRIGGKKISASVWIAVLTAAVGLFFLCGTEGLGGVSVGDLFLLGCALLYCFHILTVDRMPASVGSLVLSWLQFSFCSLFSLAAALVFEVPVWGDMVHAWLPICYAGLLSGAIGYTLQIVGQKHTDPAVASLLMSLESVFSVLAGWVILGERLSGQELIGCALVFAAVILAQTPAPGSVQNGQNQ